MMTLRWLLAPTLLTFVSSVTAHPVPFSYVDLRLQPGGLEIVVTAHDADFAHELGVSPPETLLEADVARERAMELFAIVRTRVVVEGGAGRLELQFRAVESLKERKSIRVTGYAPWSGIPGGLRIGCLLFPYDDRHQTFVNFYEGAELRHQEILGKANPSTEYYAATVPGLFAVLLRFIPAGIHHILIGPDHILFVIGLLLPGGGLWRLLRIVTAFTLAHSVTLAIAALGVWAPSPALVEPLIALSIVFVGLDNLLAGAGGRDVRFWIALIFGFIHGFGFASVLREFGLPRQALAWSLFSFNLGVEAGQAVIVGLAASLLGAFRRRSEKHARMCVRVGSSVVSAAGSWWFLQRVF